MDAHAPILIVVIEDAEIGSQIHPDRCGDLRRQRPKLVRQRRRRQAVEVRTRRLVAVGLSVPVPSQAHHAHVHLSAPADGRHVPGHVAVHQGATAPGERSLSIDRQVVWEVKGTWRDLHFFTLPLRLMKSAGWLLAVAVSLVWVKPASAHPVPFSYL